jgi:hypothetical protein
VADGVADGGGDLGSELGREAAVGGGEMVTAASRPTAVALMLDPK